MKSQSSSVPVLVLYKDPLNIWDIDRNSLIQEYTELLSTKKISFLGWKSSEHEFQENLDFLKFIDDCKYINIYSIAENEKATYYLSEEILNKLSGKAFTNNSYIEECSTIELKKLKNKLVELFEVEEQDIRILFIQSNTILLSHRDDDYYKKNKNKLDNTNYVKLTDAVLTSVAFNWSLTGNESSFRVRDANKEFTNEIDESAVMLFDPCAYKHGTTKSVPRITLSIRVANIDVKTAFEKLNKKLELIEAYS
jgi:hypothetical protein